MASLEQLCDAWPPATEVDPSANQGTMTLTGYMDANAPDRNVRDSLHGLHAGAWWTGVKVLAPGHGGARFRVKVVRNDGTKLWPAWDQDEGDWTPLPWPIPAHMAREMGLAIKVKQVGGDMNGCIFTRRIYSFLECPGIPLEEPLLFVDDDGDISGYWGPQSVYTPIAERTTSGVSTPIWGTPHTVVPLTEQLITRRDWLSYRTFTPSSWSSRAPF